MINIDSKNTFAFLYPLWKNLSNRSKTTYNLPSINYY